MARATKDSSERRVKLENVLKRAASGQTLSDKTPANSRYGSFGQLQKSPEGLQLILTKSGIAWVSEDGREHEIIPLLLADVVYAEVAQKFSFTTPDATHLIAIAPRIQSLAAVWLLCTNAGTGDFSLDHLMISFSRRGAIRWDIKDCCHFSAKCCGQGAHGSVFSGVSLLPLYDSRRRLLPEKRDVINMQKVHNFGRVAVKIWNKPPMSMIRQEVYALQAAAGHPNICSLLGLYCEGPRRKTAVIWLLALEHCTGGDLFDLIRDNYISQLQVMDILFGLFSALAHVHSLQLVHRDIKAENVVLKKHHAVLIEAWLRGKHISEGTWTTIVPSRGIHGCPTMHDFGISANVNDEQERDRRPEMMRPVGSPGYAAPEVIALVPERYNEKAVFVRASNQRDRRRPGTDWDSAEHR
ncbi:Myosin-IIIa [Durusdinium trenchii]|uniref:Myosin-IIIa n=1 Tax=Durusdinium trenchii TaxID=1381693 RepID=A0ABP0KXW0_9DINO